MKWLFFLFFLVGCSAEQPIKPPLIKCAHGLYVEPPIACPY